MGIVRKTLRSSEPPEAAACFDVAAMEAALRQLPVANDAGSNEADIASHVPAEVTCICLLVAAHLLALHASSGSTAMPLSPGTACVARSCPESLSTLCLRS